MLFDSLYCMHILMYNHLLSSFNTKLYIKILKSSIKHFPILSEFSALIVFPRTWRAPAFLVAPVRIGTLSLTNCICNDNIEKMMK